MGDSQDPAAVRVGWIGTGRMGFALARRLVGAGYDFAVFNRTRAKAEPLADLGATVVHRPADLADRDVVFVTVSASADLAAVLTGPDGLLTDPVSAPRIVVDSSSVSVDASATARAAATRRGAGFLAAPVSGNPAVVSAGRLTFAVSGPRDLFDEVEPLLGVLGRGATYVGDGEAARLVKIAHNVYLGVVIQALAEITVLAEKGGVSRAAFLGFLNDSVMGSTFSRYKTPAMVGLDFTPTFTNPLLRKDFDLGLAAARQYGVAMPIAAAAAELVTAAIGAGHTTEDFATLLIEQARRSGLELVAEDTPVDDGLQNDA
jgi:3-hydroxyisobutyrate dehydrogenase-like beta-hydroxyacid dehydrogenase